MTPADLTRYLEDPSYRPALTDAELAAARQYYVDMLSGSIQEGDSAYQPFIVALRVVDWVLSWRKACRKLHK